MRDQEDAKAIVIEMAEWADLPGLLALYQYLNPDDHLTVDDALQRHWQDILDNEALCYMGHPNRLHRLLPASWKRDFYAPENRTAYIARV